MIYMGVIGWGCPESSQKNAVAMADAIRDVTARLKRRMNKKMQICTIETYSG